MRTFSIKDLLDSLTDLEEDAVVKIYKDDEYNHAGLQIVSKDGGTTEIPISEIVKTMFDI